MSKVFGTIQKSNIKIFGLADTSAFDTLATNIKYSFACGGGNKLVFAAVDKTPDAEAVCANTAEALVRLGYKVLLMDANFRGSALTSSALPEGVKLGLSDALCGHCEASAAIIKGDKGKPDIVGMGHFSPNPARLMVPENIKNFFDSVIADYDWILVSVPPVTVYADALIFCGICEGVVLVAREKVSKVKNINIAAERVRYTGGSVTGIVLTGDTNA